MFPTDDWLETLNFYLIVSSGGRLTLDDFSDAELQAAWLEHPGTTIEAMEPAAEKLVLAFEAKAQDTEGKRKDEGGRRKDEENFFAFTRSVHPSSF